MVLHSIHTIPDLIADNTDQEPIVFIFLMDHHRTIENMEWYIAIVKVLLCLTPWMEQLSFSFRWEGEWSERLLKSMYYVTWKHGKEFTYEVERLWSTVASNKRNIVPILDFLVGFGMKECASQVHNAMSESRSNLDIVFVSFSECYCVLCVVIMEMLVSACGN